MDYKCELCEYVSHDKFNYKRHVNSKKHKYKLSYDHPNLCNEIDCESLSKLELKHNCEYCNNNFSSVANLGRHKKSCGEKIKLKTAFDEMNKCLINQLNEQIKINEQKNQLIDHKEELLKQTHEILNKSNETISVLKSEVAHLKSIVNNSGSLIKTSVSTMAYVIKNYKEAPALESLTDSSIINCEKNNVAFVENLIYEYNHNKLDVYIGDFIIKIYKKDDPSKQSVWNSDTNRLTYLIRDLITINNIDWKVDWKIDKKGIKTSKFIIEPILEYIDEQVREYIENFDIDYNLNSVQEAERKMLKLKSSTEILKNIEDKILNDQILKYIAPHFYLNKTDAPTIINCNIENNENNINNNNNNIMLLK